MKRLRKRVYALLNRLTPEQIQQGTKAHAELLEQLLPQAQDSLNQPVAPVKLPADFWELLRIKVDHQPQRRSSRGGVSRRRPWMSLALYRYLDDAMYSFIEYRHLQNKPGIGDACGDQRVMVALVFSHELAHAIQYYLLLQLPQEQTIEIDGQAFTRKELARAHGKAFQAIYRYIRTALVTTMPTYRERAA